MLREIEMTTLLNIVSDLLDKKRVPEFMCEQLKNPAERQFEGDSRDKSPEYFQCQIFPAEA